MCQIIQHLLRWDHVCSRRGIGEQLQPAQELNPTGQFRFGFNMKGVLPNLLQGKEKVCLDQLEAAVKLALDRQNLFTEDKVAADGLCRPKKEKRSKNEKIDSKQQVYTYTSIGCHTNQLVCDHSAFRQHDKNCYCVGFPLGLCRFTPSQQSPATWGWHRWRWTLNLPWQRSEIFEICFRGVV